MILIRKFAERFSLPDAMREAGYVGGGSMTAAVHDIEKHAALLRRQVICTSDVDSDEARRKRILAEYERIAFAGEEDGIKVSDKLRALEMYRVLSDPGGAGDTLVVKYDYGDGDDD